MINGSAQRSIGLTGESMPDRAEVNSAIVRCCTRVVPLRTVNERLNRDAMPDGQWGSRNFFKARSHKRSDCARQL
jgi:hypothetical protein